MKNTINNNVAELAEKAGDVLVEKAVDIADKTAELAGAALANVVETVIEQAPPKAVVLGVARGALARFTARQLLFGGLAGLGAYALYRRWRRRNDGIDREATPSGESSDVAESDRVDQTTPQGASIVEEWGEESFPASDAPQSW